MKLNFNLNLKGVKGLPLAGMLKKHISLLLLVCLVVLSLLVAFIVYGEWKKVSLARSEDLTAGTGRILRVNVITFDELTARLDENARYIPHDTENAEAFSSPASASQDN